MCSTQITCLASKLATVETLICGHPQGVKKVSTAVAGHLRECKNTVVVWEWGYMHGGGGGGDGSYK